MLCVALTALYRCGSKTTRMVHPFTEKRRSGHPRRVRTKLRETTQECVGCLRCQARRDSRPRPSLRAKRTAAHPTAVTPVASPNASAGCATMSGMYPPTRPELTGEPKDAFAVHMEVDTQVREYLIAVEQVKIMQAKLKACYEKSGPNHFEDCKELRETLWEKLNTPNYGAPGPSRSVRARNRAPSRRSPATLPSRTPTLTPPLLPTRRAVVQVHDQQQLRGAAAFLGLWRLGYCAWTVRAEGRLARRGTGVVSTGLRGTAAVREP